MVSMNLEAASQHSGKLLHVSSSIIDHLYRTSQAISVACGDAMMALEPGAAPTRVQIGTGHAVFCGDGSPLTQVSWLGFGKSVSGSGFDDVDAFYAGRAKSWEVIVNPACDPRSLAMAVQRGWTNAQYENVMVLDLGQPITVKPSEDIQVEVCDASRSDWSEVSLRGFFGDEVPPNCANLQPIISKMEGTVGFLATIDGESIAAASIMLTGDTCYLGGAATLPKFRGRGAQNALLNARLRHVQEMGCQFAFCEAIAGSQSQRNQERSGFRVVHTKVVLTRDI